MTDISSLEPILNYTYQDSSLLTTAMTHRSSLNESKGQQSNERLEFLGDAVLELIISQYLYLSRPTEAEGILTASRSAIVRTESLAQIALTLKLGDYLIMSRGEENTGGRSNHSLLANATEAVIGSIYLDGGFEAAKKFIEDHIISQAITILEKEPLKDSKSRLQEIVQKQGFSSPIYNEISATGPDHDKTFMVEVSVGDKPVAQGSGKNKQEAEQQAAQKAINLV